MTHDPAYLASVTSALLAALREAQAMADAGAWGAPLAEVVRHARELHDIMIDELVGSRDAIGEVASLALAQMGERLQSLEKTVAAS